MPNNCENELTISADDENDGANLAIWAAIRNEEASGPDFNKLLQYPEAWAAADKAAREFEAMFWALPSVERAARADEWRSRPHDSYNHGGYEWCCENWGTKLNAYNCKALSVPTEEEPHLPISLAFETAWAPAKKIAAEIARRWPNARVSLNFWERGMAFQGTATWKGGDVEVEFEAPYHGHRGG